MKRIEEDSQVYDFPATAAAKEKYRDARIDDGNECVVYAEPARRARHERRQHRTEDVVYDERAIEFYERRRTNGSDSVYGRPFRRYDGGRGSVSGISRGGRTERRQESREVIVKIEEGPPRERPRRKERERDRDRDSGLGSEYGRRGMR